LLPNPANDVATLTFNLSKKADLMLEILNGSGQILLRRALQNTQTGSLDSDTREWASGAYFIHLTDGKAVKTVKRLVVQN
jgi:Secretion system C-terminal sorting domain